MKSDVIVRRVLVVITAVIWSVSQAAAQPIGLPAREAFNPVLLPSPGLLRLGDGPPTLIEGPVTEGQVFLSIPVRHTVSGMSSAGREVDVVYRGGRPRGRPDRPSHVLPNPAPFYLAALTDQETGTPQFWWCTPGEGLRAGPMCTSGGVDSGVATGVSSIGRIMIENHNNPFLPTTLRYRTCVRGCSTAWMHHFTIAPDNQPVRPDLVLDYVLSAADEVGTRTIQRRLGGEALDTVQLSRGAELQTAVGALSLVSDGTGGVRVSVRPFSDAERARSLAAFIAGFARLIATRHPLLGEPGLVAAAGDAIDVAAGSPVRPMTQVFTQPVTLPGNEIPFPEGQSPQLFVDYVGAVGDAWDAEHQEFRPRYAWFVVGYARHTGGRWYVLAPVDPSGEGGVVLAGQRVLQITQIDGSGIATMQVTGGVPAAPSALR
jgi:hypothetical protein